MSKELLNKLNGRNQGELKDFIDSFESEISIAWYPSAGSDFHSLADIWVQNKEWGLKQPDLFICTDYHASGDYPIDTKYSKSSLEEFLFSDDVTYNFLNDSLPRCDKYKYNVSDEVVNCYVRERLPRLNFPIHPEIVVFHDFKEVRRFNGSVVFLMLRFTNHPHLSPDITIPVIYIHAENEAVAAEVFLPYHAKIDLVYHCVYGGGMGGGKARGNWIENILNKLQCKIYIKFDNFEWQNGDDAAVKFYPNLANGDDAVDLKSTSTLPLEKYNSSILSRIGSVYLLS